MNEPPPFDDEAREAAHKLAAQAGKGAHAEKSVRAIHAVVQRLRHPHLFDDDKAAWEKYESSRQRFYEWKKLLRPLLQPSSPPPPPPPPPQAQLGTMLPASAAAAPPEMRVCEDGFAYSRDEWLDRIGDNVGHSQAAAARRSTPPAA